MAARILSVLYAKATTIKSLFGVFVHFPLRCHVIPILFGVRFSWER